MPSAVGTQLRYEIILYATLAFECVYLALIFLLFQAPLGWGALFAAGAVMLFSYRFLMARGDRSGEELLLPSLLVALVVIAFLVARASGGFLPTPSVLASAFAGLFDWLSGLRPTTAALLLGLLLWVRVVLIARSTATLILTRDRIQWSLVVVLLLIIQGAAQQQGEVMPPVYGFLFVFGALLSFMLSRAHSVTRVTQAGVVTLPFTPRWLAVVVVSIIATLSVATVMTLPFSLRGARVLFELAEPLRFVLGVVVAAIFYVLSVLLGPLLDRISLEGMDEVMQEMQALGEVAATPTPGEVQALAGPGRAIIDLILVLAFLWVLGLAALYLYRLLTTEEREEDELPQAQLDTTEEPFSWGPGEWLGRVRDRFARGAPRPQPGVATVRDLYKNLLLFGDDHGLPRPDEDTPYEYLRPLSDRYPHRHPDFQALTDAYVAAHYGETAFTTEQIARLRTAWDRIAHEPRPLLGGETGEEGQEPEDGSSTY